MIKKTPRILVLTPMKDAEICLNTYFLALASLDYPVDHISLGFLEGDSSDNTYSELKKRGADLKQVYHSVGIWKKDFGFVIPNGISRHDNSIQVQRRIILAKSRNHLLFHALQDEDYVLWIDVDVEYYPADVIQQMLAVGKPVVHPHCVLESHGYTYDLNAWRNHGEDHMEDLRNEGDLVKLDSVGGTMLLIKADVHRDGLIFPPFPYGLRNDKIRTNNFWQGEIETEGLGIMADDMGVQCWGMPHLEILHKKG